MPANPLCSDRGFALESVALGATGAVAAVLGGGEAAGRLAAAIAAMPGRRSGWAGCWAIGRGRPGGEFVGFSDEAPEIWSRSLAGAHCGLARTGSPHRASPHPAAAAAGRVLGQAMAAGMAGVVHNGSSLRQAVADRGALLRGDDGAELLLHLMAQSSQRTLVNRLVDAMERLRGAFTFAVVTEEMCIAGRDPRGFRPLWIGTGEGVCAAASEPGALTAMGASVLREVGGGEIAILESGTPPRLLRPWGVHRSAACAQEWISLAPSDSTFEGLGVYALRRRLGLALAATCSATADAVVVLPGACPVAAMAFAEQLNLPMGQAFTPWPPPGHVPVAVQAAVRGRRLALIHEPSLPLAVLREAVTVLREAGARRVHLRAVAPWQVARCDHGVSLPVPWPVAGDLPAEEAIAAWCGADSALALSPQELASALGHGEVRYCDACLGGGDPLPVAEAAATPQLPLFSTVGGERQTQQAGMLDTPHPLGPGNQHG